MTEESLQKQDSKAVELEDVDTTEALKASTRRVAEDAIPFEQRKAEARIRQVPKVGQHSIGLS
jgi:hypothetical protein